MKAGYLVGVPHTADELEALDTLVKLTGAPGRAELIRRAVRALATTHGIEIKETTPTKKGWSRRQDLRAA